MPWRSREALGTPGCPGDPGMPWRSQDALETPGSDGDPLISPCLGSLTFGEGIRQEG